MRKRKKGFPPIYFLFLGIAIAAMVCIALFLLPSDMVRGAKMLILFGGVIVIFFVAVLVHAMIQRNKQGQRRR